jgi:preprotein translocase SecE subunit
VALDEMDEPDEARRRARERREARFGEPAARDTPAPREREAPRSPGSSRGFAPMRFVRECWAELQRVQWPDRVHLWQATAVVIIACVVVGTYLYALDSVFSRAAHWLVDKQTH